MSNDKVKKWKKCFIIAMIGVLSVLALVIYFKIYSYLMWGKFPVAVTEVSVDQAYDREAPGITDKILQLTDEAEIYTRENCIGGRFVKGFKPYYDASVINNGNEQVSFVVIEQTDTGDYRVVFLPHTLEPGESFELQGLDELDYYLFLYYGEGDKNNVIENISDNQYMRQYKAGIIYLSIVVMIASLLLVICILFSVDEKKINQHLLRAGWVLTAFGIFFYAVRSRIYLSDLSLLGAFVSVIYSALFKRFTGEKETLITDSRKRASLISGVISSLVSFGLFLLIVTSKEGSVLYPISPAYGKNILDYCILLFSFLVLYLIMQYVLLKYCYKNHTDVIEVNHMQKQQMLGIVIVMIYLVRTHMTKYVQNPMWLICLFTVAYCIVIYHISSQYIRSTSHNDREKTGRIVIVLDIVLMVIVFVGMIRINEYCMDAMDKVYGAVHHMSAQYDTIISIFNDNLFNGSLEVHGHYALFFVIPLLIFGKHMWVIAMTYALFIALAFAMTLFVINRNLKTDFLKLLTSVAVFAAIGIGDMQLAHRYVFVAVLLFIVTCHKESNHKRWIFVGYIACILSLIWSTEAGLVVSVAWAVYMVLFHVRNVQKCFGACIKSFILQLGILVIEIIIYSFIIMFYNGIVSSNARQIALEEASETEIIDSEIAETEIIDSEIAETEVSDTGVSNKEIIFGVMANDEYMNYHTGKNMETGNLSGYYILIFYLGLAAYELYYMNLFGKTEKRDQEVLTVLTIASIGLYTYTVSHSINNPETCSIYLSLTICLLFGELLELRKKRYAAGKNNAVSGDNLISNIAYVIMIFSIGFITSFTFSRLNQLQKDIVEYRVMDNSYWLQEVRKFDELVPPNTAIYNKMSGLDEIYFELGREDIDISLEEADYVISNMDLTGMGYMVEREIYFARYRYILYRIDK